MRVGNDVNTVRIVGEEEHNNIGLNPKLIGLYAVITEKKKIPTIAVKNGARRGTSSSLTISIRDMLKNVKDYNGNNYINEDGTGNFAQLKEEIINTKAFKKMV